MAHSNVASARIAAFHLSSNGFIMNFILQPWQFLLIILAGWVHRQQQLVIDYLRTENQILKEKLGKRRILLNDDQRRRLAVKGCTSPEARRIRTSSG